MRLATADGRAVVERIDEELVHMEDERQLVLFT